MKSLLVDTIPKDARNSGSINLGFEIVSSIWEADRCHWRDIVDVSKYDRIGFNVFYPTHLLNIWPFVRRNKIEDADIRFVAGGQGIGKNHILSEIVDREYYGELDAKRNVNEVTSDLVIKGKNAAIEISRGCRMKCGFCEYRWSHSFREKRIGLVKEQIKECVGRGINRINFMSSNFGGYSSIDELMDFCVSVGARPTNCDSCLSSVHRLLKWSKYLPKYIKVGVESFDESARKHIGKPFVDSRLRETLEKMFDLFSGVHLYLIYGLPNDDYSKWFKWVAALKKMREKHSKNIRVEFNITNFEPCLGTPMEIEDEVCFRKKEKFVSAWGACLMKNGFFKGDSFDYKNTGGRIGRKELSYKMLMALKNGGPELTEELKFALPHGIGRSISDDEAAEFLFWREK